MIDDDRTPDEIEYARVMQKPTGAHSWMDRANDMRISAYPENLDDPWPAIEPTENPGHLEPVPCGDHTVHSEHAWESSRWGNVECLGVGRPDQCPMPVHSGYGSAPERCAFPSGHEGECEP